MKQNIKTRQETFNQKLKDHKKALKSDELSVLGLAGLDLNSLDLSHANLKDTNLHKVDLTNVILNGANITDVNRLYHLKNGKSDSSNLRKIKMYGVKF